MPRFELIVGEPWDFENPDGRNRICLDLIGKVEGPDEKNWTDSYLLFAVLTPFEYKGEIVAQVIAAPRYVGTSLVKVRFVGGTVGVARVRPGISFNEGHKFAPSDIEYIIIGELKRPYPTNRLTKTLGLHK